MDAGWFSTLFGIEECDYQSVKENFVISSDGTALTSLANHRQFEIGSFSTPTLGELRTRGKELLAARDQALTEQSKLNCDEIAVRDVLSLHHQYPGATFQAASQFNCLEFPSPDAVPERGIVRYQSDNTQGPACALACAAGTLFRNYFAPVVRKDGTVQIGQTRNVQLNNLDELELALNNEEHEYWTVKNGYTFSDDCLLRQLRARLASDFNSVDLRDTLLAKIKVGLHRDVGVDFQSRFHSRFVPVQSGACIRVTQVYASALSCAYSGIGNRLWEPLGKNEYILFMFLLFYFILHVQRNWFLTPCMKPPYGQQ